VYLHGRGGLQRLHLALPALSLRLWLVALDLRQQVGLALDEVGVGELPRVCVDLTETLHPLPARGFRQPRRSPARGR